MYAISEANYPTLDQIDSFGLTPVQFRVYLHLRRLAQNGTVSVSSDNISKYCSIARITVVRALSHLSQMRLIECDRTLGKKSVFYLMPFSEWKSLATIGNSKVTPIKHKQEDTCISEIPVSQINQRPQAKPEVASGLQLLRAEEQQESTRTPLKGGSVDPVAVEPVSQINQVDPYHKDTGGVKESGMETEVSLNDKIEQARRRGWWDAGVWYDDLGTGRVTVNRFVVSLEEFMQRSLDSFDVGKQVCESGLAMCRQQIEKIKSRIRR